MATEPDTDSTAATDRRASLRLLAGMSGNVLEWYDIGIYSSFASLFGRLFFPADDPTSSLLASFGVFASGQLMRPIGALLFGSLADRSGRSQTLLLSLLCISIPTMLMGLLPVHSQIGPWAAVLLVLLRLIQGVSLGGEYSTSMAWLVEQAPLQHRGFHGSWATFGGIAGFTLGIIAAALVALLPQAAVTSWGWRLPFLCSGVMAWMGWLLRRQWQNDPQPPPEQPGRLGPLLRRNRKALVRVGAFHVFTSVGFYLLATYLVGELNTRMTLPMATVFWISTTALMAMLVVIPLAGALSDRWGRKPLLVVAFLGVLLFGRNGFALTQASAPGAVLAGELVLALFYGIAFGITPVWIIEATSGAGRCTTIGLAYNLCTGVVGGLTPLVATLLVQRSGNILAPIWQWQAAAVISLAAVLLDGPIRIRQPRPASIAATEQDD